MDLRKDEALKEAYKLYIESINLRRLRIGFLFGIALFPAGSFFDYFIYPEQFSTFLCLRWVFTAVYIVAFLLSFTNFIKKHVSLVMFILVECTIIPIVIMIMKTGGHASPYYGWLTLIVFGFGVLFTLSMKEAFAMCSLVYLTYLLPIFFFDEITNLRTFLNNNYFLSFIIIMALISNYFNLRLRFRNFENRYKLNNAMDELKNAQTQLLHSAKLASVGELAAGVAHELNNALNVLIVSNLHLKKMLLKLDVSEKIKDFYQSAQEDVERLSGGMERAHNVVKSLLTFSKKNAEGFQYQNANEGVESTLQMLNTQFTDKKIRLHKELCLNGEIYCDLNQLNQVFFNILKNACDAVAEEGEIWVRTWREEKSFYISIRDNGKGIAKEHLNRIFDPFFTTKPIGQGTGLGLSISYNIVKTHHGQIHCHSTPGHGTEFKIELPTEKEKIYLKNE